jgi:putative tryptophan/tyrosine transport system substrate-binding protein
LGEAIRRREFVISVAGAALAWPLAAQAQQPDRMRRIGMLMGFAESDHDAQSWVMALREELRNLGWMEGRNVEMEIRWAADRESMKQFATELVALQPDQVVTSTTPATAAMLQQTRTIPVIFVLVGDPIFSGFVASLARPGGNVTGFTPIVGSLAGKWVELLKDIAPRVARVTLLFNPATATYVERYVDPFRAAAASLGVEAIVAPVNDMPELESIFTTQAREPNSGFVVIPDVFTQSRRAEITSLAAGWRVPAIYWSRSFAEIGGLISYGPYILDEFRRTASYVDRILKGAKPGDLPVQAPVKFELVINVKNAKALGLTVPQTLVVAADEVIE